MLLASSGRDRLLHIFNADENYNFLRTIDDHSSAITAVRFVKVGGQMKMLSASVDKSIIYRDLVVGVNGLEFQRSKNLVTKAFLYDLEVDPQMKSLLVAGQDRQIR